MRKRVNKIISAALSATLAFGVFTALPMSANAVVSTASEVSAEAIPKHELYKSYTYGGYKYRIVGQKSNGRFNAWIESYSGKSANVNVPASVGDCDMVGIDNNCFSFNKTLKTIIVPKGIAEIGSSAFLGCTALTSVSLPSTLTKINFWAFKNCTSLSTLSIPSSVVSIGDNAFDNCLWYTNQSNGIVYAGKVAYKYKGKLADNSSVTIKSGTVSIADYAFTDQKLTSVTLPSSLVSIGEQAFSYTNLKTVTIPKSVSSMGYNPFAYCSQLSSITVQSGNTNFYVQNDLLIAKNHMYSVTKDITDPDAPSTESRSYTSYAPYGSVVISLPSASTLKTVTIPETVKAIGNYAFAGSKIEKLTLNSGLESILTSAFSGCTNLSSVSFSDSIISICDSSFEECTSLKNLKFGKNLEFISYYAFYNCQNLQSVTIMENVKAICCDSFGNCNALVINGKIGSTAETFAKKYGYKFNSSETTRLKGDVDNNGIINVVDATDIQKYVVNLTDENGNKFIDINNAEDVYVADVNGDGIINVVDATLIQKYLVRLVESL